MFSPTITAGPSYLRRLPHLLARRGTAVLLTWTTWSGDSLDPATGSHLGTPLLNSGTVNALLHPVSAEAVLRERLQLKSGDLIASFAPTVDLESLESLRFTIDGKQYAQKRVAESVVTFIDGYIGDHRLLQNVVLTLAT